jgi:hypothetical protein
MLYLLAPIIAPALTTTLIALKAIMKLLD